MKKIIGLLVIILTLLGCASNPSSTGAVFTDYFPSIIGIGGIVMIVVGVVKAAIADALTTPAKKWIAWGAITFVAAILYHIST